MRTRLLVLLLFCPGVLASAVTPGMASASGAKAGTPAPDFSLPTDTGTVSLEALQGKVVLVDFWASWCGPCQHSFPWLRDMAEKYGDAGLEVVAVSLDKDHGAAQRFLQKHPAPFTVAFDPKAETARNFRVRGMPTSVLIGPDGSVIYSHIGFDPKHTEEFEEMIAKACGS